MYRPNAPHFLALSYLAGALSREGHTGQVWSYTAKETHRRCMVAAEKGCRCPDGVSHAETFPNIKAENFALDVPLGFCKWLDYYRKALSETVNQIYPFQAR